jgi:hypothetical protein
MQAGVHQSALVLLVWSGLVPTESPVWRLLWLGLSFRISQPYHLQSLVPPTMSSPEAEAGPSRPTQTSGPKPPLARKRKAGGDGKKGKVFLEDKVRFPSCQGGIKLMTRRASYHSWPTLLAPKIRS